MVSGQCRSASHAGCCCRQRRACDKGQGGEQQLAHSSCHLPCSLCSPAAVRDHDGAGVHSCVLVNLWGGLVSKQFGSCTTCFSEARVCNCSWRQDARGRDCSSHRTAPHSTAQHSTAQHSTAQHRTAQHSTAQHSRAHLHPEVGEGGGQVLRAGEEKSFDLWCGRRPTGGDATAASSTSPTASTTVIEQPAESGKTARACR